MFLGKFSWWKSTERSLNFNALSDRYVDPHLNGVTISKLFSSDKKALMI